MTAAEQRINELFEELVPASGKADTVAGEIIRAISRIGYRNYNDGDHIGVGYGKETCNPAARYLIQYSSERMGDIICDMWGVYEDNRYNAYLNELEIAVLEFIDGHPELRTAANDVDMWSCRTDEDVDDWEDEEEYY